MRGARAPAAGHSTHFNPKHRLLCHMGLYKFEFEFEFAWALRHKPARIAVFADRGAATRRPGAEKPRTYETYYSNRRDFKKKEKR
jgi:hypothetical protein